MVDTLTKKNLLDTLICTDKTTTRLHSVAPVTVPSKTRTKQVSQINDQLRTHNVTLRRVRATTVAVEKKYYIF
jgi:hypothetical protein